VSAFLDTNILLYSIATKSDELHKRQVAIALLETEDLRLSVQVLLEFYAQATRATAAHAIRHEDATELIAAWRRFPVIETTLALFDRGIGIRAATGFSLWDAMIVAAALESGCHRLFSEDLQHGRNIEGVQIINPFRT